MWSRKHFLFIYLFVYLDTFLQNLSLYFMGRTSWSHPFLSFVSISIMVLISKKILFFSFGFELKQITGKIFPICCYYHWLCLSFPHQSSIKNDIFITITFCSSWSSCSKSFSPQYFPPKLWNRLYPSPALKSMKRSMRINGFSWYLESDIRNTQGPWVLLAFDE